MHAKVRRKLEMAARALDFAQAHPGTDASYLALVARLRDRVTQADALAVQQQDGTTGERAANSHRKALRRTIQQVQLRHVVDVAHLAADDDPDLVGLFVYPDSGGPYQTFVTAAKALLAAAMPHERTFISLGLGDTFLADLAVAIAEFDQATYDANAARGAHVGARAQLVAVARECVKLAGILDGLYQIRFRSDPQALAAWESAKNVVARGANVATAVAAAETRDSATVPRIRVWERISRRA